MSSDLCIQMSSLLSAQQGGSRQAPTTQINITNGRCASLQRVSSLRYETLRSGITGLNFIRVGL